MCGIICCGVTSKTKNCDNTPEGYSTPLKQTICPYCSYKGDTIYRRRVMYFTLFFVPLFPVKKDEPYLSCMSCEAMLGRRRSSMCKKCNGAVPESFVHCVRCGNDMTAEERGKGLA